MNHKHRLQKLEKHAQPAALTWRELVDIARMDEPSRDNYMQANPEKHAAFMAAMEAAGDDAETKLQALR